MKVAKDGIRSIVRIGYDGKVHKKFRGTDKEIRFANEVKVLKELEARGCDFVPRLLEADEESLTIVTTNCGSPVEKLSDGKVEEIFKSLEDGFGVIHDDPFLRNITYDSHRGRFCVIDFELAEVRGMPIENSNAEILDWAGLTRSGARKAKNEDAMSVFSSRQGWAEEEAMSGSRSIEKEGLIFAVSDGMGGHAGGEVASRTVVGELHRFLPAMMGDFTGNADSAALLESAISALHGHVIRIANSRPNLKNMGATLVCGLFFRGELHFGHIGDSRLYLFRDGKLTQLTHDHSFVGKLMKAGKMNEREARMHPRRNVLTQAIGARCQFIHPQVSQSSIKKGDWFLICSDGVTDGLWDKHIEEEFLMAELARESAAKAASSLLERAFSEAGRDDTTLFVIKAE